MIADLGGQKPGLVIRVRTLNIGSLGEKFPSDCRSILTSSDHHPEPQTPLVIIGWREWVSLPALGVRRTKAKIDTGARSSSLHAFEIEPFDIDGKPHVRFQVHPIQRRDNFVVSCQAEVHDIRMIRSSSGETSERFVIRTPVSWMGESWEIDLTLADRSLMGFRMLIGREAVRGRMLVDPDRSFFGPRPHRHRRHPPSLDRNQGDRNQGDRNQSDRNQSDRKQGDRKHGDHKPK